MRIINICILLCTHCAISFAQITINPGDNISSIVNSHPGGTTFIVKPGVYRMQWINPKNNDIFIADTGVILNGSKILTSFVQQENYWVATGQTQQGQVHGDCIDGYECRSPEDLFINDKPLWKVSTKEEVVPGKWYFDYSGNEIYFMDDPTGKIVETSVTKHAFEGSADNVTIKGFIIEKYANPPQFGAINARSGNIGNAGVGWIIEDNEVRLNHGAGIIISDSGIVRNNYCHDNGQLGMGGVGLNILIDGNEISHNCEYAGFNWQWEGGGTKFALTDSLTIRDNFVHDNAGPGLWTDIDNIHTLYEGNLVEDNKFAGIFHEISYDAVIRCNTSRRNGKDFNSNMFMTVAQIFVSASKNVKIFNNTVVVDALGGDGILLMQQNRVGPQGPYLVMNDSIYDNEIFYMGKRGQTGAFTDCSCNPDLFTSNYFNGNTYHQTDIMSRRSWVWNKQQLLWSGFIKAGQETAGVANSDTGKVQTPGCFTPSTIVNPIELLSEATVYPNPSFIGMFTIKLENGKWKTGNIQIEIYNGHGEKMRSITVNNQQDIYEIDISHLPTGIYFVRIYNKENFCKRKIVIL